MTKFIFFLCFASTLSAFSQDISSKSTVQYLNMTSLSTYKNTESYFLSDEVRRTDGLGFELSSIHGARFFGFVALSAGISLDYNINKTFVSNPIIFDLRFFSKRGTDGTLFAYFQTGPNLKWSNNIETNGNSSKFGAGAFFDFDEHVSYFVDVFRKTKSLNLKESVSNDTYNVVGYGISIGVKF